MTNGQMQRIARFIVTSLLDEWGDTLVSLESIVSMLSGSQIELHNMLASDFGNKSAMDYEMLVARFRDHVMEVNYLLDLFEGLGCGRKCDKPVGS